MYGILLRHGRVLIAAERVGERDVLKFPGGAVEPDETPEEALVREFHEEGALVVAPTRLLHVPGTLFSPWTHGEYTPIYYLVRSDGTPQTPVHEPLELVFMDPEEAMRSGRMAEPEVVALRRALRA